tara:strand:- start:417934 stop:418440 length:507 start_codon:yes stop_codon:yes gene_type:complete
VSLPALPEVFGNYALKDFVEVTAPMDINWWPQTAGWLVVGVLAACLLLYRIGLRVRHWYRNRYRREAIKRLRLLHSTTTPETLPSEVNRLLKITAMVAYSRERVARLSGRQWVDFLNGQCSTPVFSEDSETLLTTGAYQLQSAQGPRADRLIAASLLWVETHRSRFDD